MTNIKISLVLATSCMLYCGTLQAATAINSGSVSNTYLFIDNNVDNEFFITPGLLDPRFTGSNVWTRYSTYQTSLGYMGYALWGAVNRYFDMWLTDSPISHPFNGIRCMSNGSSCPSSGYLPADATDNEGFYHALSGNSVYNGSYGSASLSQSAYAYFRNQTVGAIDNFTLNFCYTLTNFDHASGEKCRDLSSGAYWYYLAYKLTKVGHLTLKNTGALSEVFIASDGSSSVASGDSQCYSGIANQSSGVICKMLSYSLQQTQRVTAYLDFRMVVDTAQLGFTPAASEIKFSGDGASWINFSTPTIYTNVFSTSGEYVYVFISNEFFKKMLNTSTQLSNSDSLFTFYFDNAVTPESGYYQFTASNKITITPKEYGISIVSSDGHSHPRSSGKIGDEKPIEFEYKVITSATRQADSITAQVTGESILLDGLHWCLFTSTDQISQVPIPAYLSWTSRSGTEMTTRNSCGESAIDMTDANWVQTAWNAAIDEGYFFTTTLKLIFPMNHSRSNFTTTGLDWMGTVSASGEIKVTASWIGVDL